MERIDPDILRYAHQGLFVTWSPVPHSRMDGAESFLVAVLGPLKNKQIPTAPQVSVNLPWQRPKMPARAGDTRRLLRYSLPGMEVF